MLIAPLLQDTAFVSSWKTDNAGVSSSTQITVPTISSGSYACQVDWGDGTSSIISTYNDAAWTHTYSVAGTYTVKIYGRFNGIQFNNGGDRLKLLKILRWGTGFRLGTSQGAYFYGCANLVIEATDILNLTGTTSLASAFRSCTSIVTIPNMQNWNVSAVTATASMFNACSQFNQALTNWNTSAVTTMSNMFNGCTVFNQSVSNFNTANVTLFNGMFNACPAFNQSVSNFNTAAATTLNNMFAGCAAFNQSVSNFNTANCANMTSMFANCAAFDQDVSTFDIRALTVATNMFSGSGFTITNYDKLLNNVTGWPGQATIQNSVVFNAGTAHYSAGAPTTGRAVLTVTKSWTITDGGTP